MSINQKTIVTKTALNDTMPHGDWCEHILTTTDHPVLYNAMQDGKLDVALSLAKDIALRMSKLILRIHEMKAAKQQR